jgi:hypothetical protein
MTKRFDNDGHVRGAMGIDSDRHNDFSRRHMSKESVISHYQLPPEPAGSRRPIDVDYQGAADTKKGAGSRMLNGARQGTDPILSRGDETHPGQTGIRHVRKSTRRSGAF